MQGKALKILPTILANSTSAAGGGGSSKRSVALAKQVMDIPLEVSSENDPRKKKQKNNAKRAKNKLRKKNKNSSGVSS